MKNIKPKHKQRTNELGLKKIVVRFSTVRTIAIMQEIFKSKKIMEMKNEKVKVGRMENVNQEEILKDLKYIFDGDKTEYVEMYNVEGDYDEEDDRPQKVIGKHADGSISCEGIWFNRIPEGIWSFYDKNGQVLFRGEFFDCGVSINFTEKHRKEINDITGEEEDIMTLSTNDTYEDKNKQDFVKFYPNSRKINRITGAEDEFRRRFELEFYDNGSLYSFGVFDASCCGAYRRGTKVGLWEYFYPDGTRYKAEYYDDNGIPEWYQYYDLDKGKEILERK